MAKSNSIANDAQLKARRTNLEKKSKDELINIILRKDSTERKNNAKIQELTALLKEADSLNEEKATLIRGLENDMDKIKDYVKTKQERIDSLLDYNNKLKDEVAECCKKYVNFKNVSSFRRKIILCCFGIIAILVVLLFVLG